MGYFQEPDNSEEWFLEGNVSGLHNTSESTSHPNWRRSVEQIIWVMSY
jgi:hypothetical protein